ncbi:MAG: hypothetical protein WCU00_01130 [Candidatus Latescibacterota bacterium]
MRQSQRETKGIYTEQIIRNPSEAEVFIVEGMTAAEASLKINVIEQTYYRRREEYGGMEC